MKRFTWVSLLLFLLAVILGLIQLWFHPWNEEIFVKLILTDAALLVVSLVVGFLLREIQASKKMQGGNGLD